MRNRFRSPDNDSPAPDRASVAPNRPGSARAARARSGGTGGFGLDTMFEHQPDVVTSPAGRGPRAGRDGSGMTRRPRAVVVLVVVGVLLLIAAVAVTVRVATGDSSATAADPTDSRQDTGTPPAELPTFGSAIRSRVTADGDVVVTQWIRGRFPVTDLRVPKPPDGTGAARVGAVTVVADGTAVQPLADAADPTIRFVFGVPARVVYLRYVLKRAVEQSSSAPGRALVRTAFLPVEYSPAQGPMVVTVTAPEVLSMSCSNRQAVLSSPRPCGAPTAGGWRVTLRDNARQDDVVAQVDLDD